MSDFEKMKMMVDGDVDRISQLPDYILSHILSFLSPRDAVRTRVLARGWRFLYSSSTNLRFDLRSMTGICHDKYPTNSTHMPRFLAGVDQFLHSYSNPKIDSFHVSYRLRNDSATSIDEWIKFSLNMHTSSISLDFQSCGMEGADFYSFPCHLLLPTQTSHLKHLYLNGCNLTPDSAAAQLFNSLTTLNISNVQLQESHLHHILSGCLNLESLILKECQLPHPFRVHGPLPHLKSLFVVSWGNHGIVELYNLEKLETFDHIGYEVKFKFIYLPALKNIHFGFHPESGRGSDYAFSKLAKDLPLLESLSLDFDGLEVPIPERMPMFKHLIQLQLSAAFSWGYDVLTVMHILSASPTLQNFHLMISYDGKKTYNYKTSGVPENAPQHLHLKKVQINGFSDRPSERDLVRYFLKNCPSLKSMTISTLDEEYRGFGRWLRLRGSSIRVRQNLEEFCELLLNERTDARVEIIGRTISVILL